MRISPPLGGLGGKNEELWQGKGGAKNGNSGGISKK